MTRLLSMALLVAIAANIGAATESPLLDYAPVHMLAQNDSAPAQPSYDQLLAELESAKSKLAETEAELQTLMSQQYSTNNGEDHARELQELREATGFTLNDRQLDQFNHDPPSQGDTPGPGGEAGDLATQAQNPVGAMWMLWFQNDMKLLEGPLGGKRIFNTTVFQPVMPVQLNDKWRVINRPVLTFNAFEVPGGFRLEPPNTFPGFPIAPSDPFNTKWGLGDTMFAQYFSASGNDDKFLWGIGETWMFPSATEKALGTGKTSLGPAALGIWLGEKWIIGAIMQQWWSIGGADSRQRVSLMDIQTPLRYRINPMVSLGAAPNIQWDQVTGKWTVPLGFGFDSTSMSRNKKPLRYGAEIYYYASHRENEFDPEWQFRMFFVPIIPSPDCAQRGLCGGSRHGRHCHCRRCCR